MALLELQMMGYPETETEQKAYICRLKIIKCMLDYVNTEKVSTCDSLLPELLSAFFPIRTFCVIYIPSLSSFKSKNLFVFVNNVASTSNIWTSFGALDLPDWNSSQSRHIIGEIKLNQALQFLLCLL